MKKMIVIILFLSLGFVFAQDTTNSSFEYTKKYNKLIEEIKDITVKDYISKIDDYRKEADKYIEYKKHVCNGEFSTIILNDHMIVNDAKENNRLSSEEKLLCFRELKALQITYINNMYVAKKRFLKDIHSKSLEALSSSREESISIIRGEFDKKTKKKKSKKRRRRKKKKTKKK